MGKKARAKKAIFDQQFLGFWGGVGSKVRFNSRREPDEWEVIEIEQDWQACKWTKGGKMPMFIKLQRVVQLKGKKTRTDTVWTFTDALKPPQPKKGQWEV